MENMNDNGNGSAGCEMSARAAEVSPLTTPIDSPPSPAPTKPGATAVAATPPANRRRVLPRRERPRPTFTPTQRAHPPEPNQEPVTETNTEAPLPDHTLRVEYEIRVLGGNEDVATIKSRFDLPLALKEESLARTDGDFADVFDKIVVAPLITQVRAHLQGRFDHYAEMKAKQLATEAALPSPPNGQYKPTKPANAASFAMPELDTKPPLPTRPGSRDWAGTGNGCSK